MLRNLVLFMCLMSALRADVTIRYKNEFKFASFLPSPMAQTMLAPLTAAMPPTAVIQIKGSKGYSNYGKFISILDFDKQEITLVDAANKKCASQPMTEYMNNVEAAMPKMPTDAGPMKSMKTNVSSHKTGRTEVIQGLRAEETEMVMSIELSEAMGPMPAGPFMKLVLHAWNVQPEEVLRVPAVRAWAGYNAYGNYLMDPLATMRKILARMPGMGEGMASLMKEQSQAPMLKTHMEMYMPGIAAMMQKSGQEGTASVQFDPNVPIVETNSEMVELSTAAIDDSVFQQPADCQPATGEELLKSLMHQAAPSAPSAPPATPDAQTSRRIRVDGNVQAANLIHKVEPVYPPLAEQARVQGTVQFTITIDKQGHVVKADLVSGHPLLVNAAKEAVMQWVYRPTLLNGQPTEVVSPAEVKFSLP